MNDWQRSMLTIVIFGLLTHPPAAPFHPFPGGTQETAMAGREGGVIAYSITSPRDDNQIFVMNAEGSGRQQITRIAGRACGPDWSPDGSRIAFYRHLDDQTWSLFVVNADGGGMRRITDTPNVWDSVPRWSPDGTKIVFGRTYPREDGRTEIWIIEADGASPRRLGGVFGNGPSWSNDGTKLLFFAPVGAATEIFEMDSDGTHPRQLTRFGSEIYWPKYSPDNQRIVFESNRDGDPEIYVMSLDGSRIDQLTKNDAEDGAPEWSPDGQSLVFASNRGGHFEIFRMNADGSHPQKLTATAGQAIQPDWRPALRVSIPAQDIHQAAKNGNLDALKSLWEKDKNLLKSTDDVGYTPLHNALIRARWDVALFLLEAGADVQIQGTEGGTPLHCAANYDNVDVIRLLVEKGAVLEAKNAWGNTPLSLASERGCEKAVRALVALGADVQTRSLEGWTPLHYAYQSGHSAVQKALIEAGASETAQDQSGKIPSDYAIRRPSPVGGNPARLKDYAGEYHMGADGFITISLAGGRLMLEDFAVDEIYPIAKDTFYHTREPWKVRFYRNEDGVVDKIVVEVQRNTLTGKKVSTRDEIIEKPRLGIRTRPLAREDLSVEQLSRLFFELKAGPQALLVTFVQENSVSQKAGIRVQDIIVEFNNYKLQEPGDLPRLLYDVKILSEVPVTIFRDGKAVSLILNLAGR